jgi:hypothetical protein
LPGQAHDAADFVSGERPGRDLGPDPRFDRRDEIVLRFDNRAVEQRSQDLLVGQIVIFDRPIESRAVEAELGCRRVEFDRRTVAWWTACQENMIRTPLGGQTERG